MQLTGCGFIIEPVIIQGVNSRELLKDSTAEDAHIEPAEEPQLSALTDVDKLAVQRVAIEHLAGLDADHVGLQARAEVLTAFSKGRQGSGYNGCLSMSGLYTKGADAKHHRHLVV